MNPKLMKNHVHCSPELADYGLPTSYRAPAAAIATYLDWAKSPELHALIYISVALLAIARVQDALLTACKLANVFLVNGIAVSMVMKYADNIVKVYSTSVAMLLTAVVSVFLFGFNLTLAFFLGAT